jgi:dipeptidyl aminopeptidase/acylaminoacyl peptidase
MKTRRLGVISAVLLSALLCGGQKQTNSTQTEKFQSPDGTIIAFVRSTKAPEATKESRIELRSQDGRVLASRNYASKDGEHGHGVTKAAWTPDSQFFVYSLESSGGHQAWHTPVQFFPRSKSAESRPRTAFSQTQNRIVSLDDTLKDPVTNPQFLVSAPDSVTVELMSMRQTKTVSLHDLQGR